MDECMNFQEFVDKIAPALHAALKGRYSVRLAEVAELRPGNSHTTVLLTQFGSDAPNITTIFNAYFLYTMRYCGDFETYIKETAREIEEHTEALHG